MGKESDRESEQEREREGAGAREREREGVGPRGRESGKEGVRARERGRVAALKSVGEGAMPTSMRLACTTTAEFVSRGVSPHSRH